MDQSWLDMINADAAQDQSWLDMINADAAQESCCGCGHDLETNSEEQALRHDFELNLDEQAQSTSTPELAASHDTKIEKNAEAPSMRQIVMQASRYGYDSSSARAQAKKQAQDQAAAESAGNAPSQPQQSSNRAGRASAYDLKNDALNIELAVALQMLSEPCNSTCHLGKKCTLDVSCKELLDERVSFFGSYGTPGPNDRERAKKIWTILQTRTSADSSGKLSFHMNNRRVCPAAFLRVNGLIVSNEVSKAPGQFLRLMKAKIENKSEAEVLAAEKIKLDIGEKFTTQRGHHKSYISMYCEYYSDTIPTVKSKFADVLTYSVPFSTVMDFWTDFLCASKAAGCPEALYGSYSTFNRAFSDMYDDGLVQLLGGKGGFQTCSICNNALAIKKSAAGRRDLGTIEIVKKLMRQHLLYQQNERQHAENFIELSKNLYTNNAPAMFYICIDGQTLEATKAPVMSKDRSHKHATMENRNMGARIVCGPIDEYMSICIGNLLPGGANVLIECVRLATETLAKKLSELPEPFPLPKKGGYNFDNCGENKNKELLCYLSHLVESCYFDYIEVFFLVVGHTHNPVDRWFSLLARSILAADFIGSTIAMQELFKLACRNELSLSDPTVIEMHTYRDYRAFYEPVLNTEIHNFSIPHRFLIERHHVWGTAFMRYMLFSPKAGWGNKWQPYTPAADDDHPDRACSIGLSKFMIFGGEAAMLAALGAQSAATSFGDVASSAYGASSQSQVNQDVLKSMQYIRELEVNAIAEMKEQMDREADNGISIYPDQLNISAARLKVVEQELLKDNSAIGDVGYIIWLKRSQCEDPHWLDGTPDVLPNPKKWLQQMANRGDLASAASIEITDALTRELSALAVDNEETAATALELEEAILLGLEASLDRPGFIPEAPEDTVEPLPLLNPETATAAAPPVVVTVTANQGTQKKKLSKEERQAKQDRDKLQRLRSDATVKYAKIKSGAAKMVATTNFMLEQLSTDPNVEGRVGTSTSWDIATATSGFTKAVLSAREIAFYNGMLSVDQILGRTQAHCNAAEAEPWALLRLPSNTEELNTRKLKIKEDYDALLLKKEANLTRLLTKKGQQMTEANVVSMDGFAAVLATTVDDMTKDQLKQIARSLNVPLTARGLDNKLKEKGKDILLADVKAALAKPENQHVDPVALVVGGQGRPGTLQPNHGAITGGVDTAAAIAAPGPVVPVTNDSRCCVNECESSGSINCGICQLAFCAELHAMHDGHIMMQLKNGYSFPRPDSAPGPPPNDGLAIAPGVLHEAQVGDPGPLAYAPPAASNRDPSRCATTVDDMTKDQLKQIARSLNVPLTARGLDNKLKEKGKDILLADVKAALAKPENQHVDPVALVVGGQGRPGTLQPNHGAITGGVDTAAAIAAPGPVVPVTNPGSMQPTRGAITGPGGASAMVAIEAPGLAVSVSVINDSEPSPDSAPPATASVSLHVEAADAVPVSGPQTVAPASPAAVLNASDSRPVTSAPANDSLEIILNAPGLKEVPGGLLCPPVNNRVAAFGPGPLQVGTDTAPGPVSESTTAASGSVAVASVGPLPSTEQIGGKRKRDESAILSSEVAGSLADATLTRIEFAASKVRQILAQSASANISIHATESALERVLSYTTYDPSFLLELAGIFKVDIYESMGSSRPKRDQVRACLVKKLASM
jgi:hypothetical protein